MAYGGSDVRVHGYRNGVGCRAIVILTASYGVTCSARRCDGDGLCCAVVAPSPRSASCGGKCHGLALTDCGVAADDGADVRLHGNCNGIGVGTSVNAVTCYGVGGCCGRRYGNGIRCHTCAPIP